MRPEPRHLHLAPMSEEWPDDLLTLLGQARDGYLEGPAVRPSAEVQAFLDIPAHGQAEAATAVSASEEPEAEPLEIVLLPVGGARRPTPRRLAGLAGAAAALLLVAFGVRPALTGASADEPVVPASSVAPTTPSTTPTSTVPASTVPATTVPVVAAAPASPAPTAPAAAPPPTTAPSAAASPAAPSAASSRSSGTTAKRQTKPATSPPAAVAPASPKPAPAPAPPAPSKPAASKPAPAKPKPPTPAATPRQAVAAYYVVANERGRCVARLGAGKSRAQKIAACGPEPVPPANLVQYWAAKTAWSDCAAPLQAKGWKTWRVEARCGARPDRADYDVPPNPFSRSN
jgi:hypothetical protein